MALLKDIRGEQMKKITGYTLMTFIILFLLLGEVEKGLLVCYAAIFIYNMVLGNVCWKERRYWISLFHYVLAVAFLVLLILNLIKYIR
jgi:hypothetical protein